MARTPTQTLIAKRRETMLEDLARLHSVRRVTASETGQAQQTYGYTLGQLDRILRDLIGQT